MRAGLAGLGLIALSFLPLVVHELTTNFAEVQAALDLLPRRAASRRRRDRWAGSC